MSPSADTMVSIIGFSVEPTGIVDAFCFVQPRARVFFSAFVRGFPLTRSLYSGIRPCSHIVHIPSWRIFALLHEGVYDSAAGLFSAPERLVRSCFDDILK